MAVGLEMPSVKIECTMKLFDFQCFNLTLFIIITLKKQRRVNIDRKSKANVRVMII